MKKSKRYVTLKLVSNSPPHCALTKRKRKAAVNPTAAAHSDSASAARTACGDSDMPWPNQNEADRVTLPMGLRSKSSRSSSHLQMTAGEYAAGEEGDSCNPSKSKDHDPAFIFATPFTFDVTHFRGFSGNTTFRGFFGMGERGGGVQTHSLRADANHIMMTLHSNAPLGVFSITNASDPDLFRAYGFKQCVSERERRGEEKHEKMERRRKKWEEEMTGTLHPSPNTY
jgi:hypothetical protein